MLQSMTGYGKAEGSYLNKNITIEIRALNSKQSDINLKLPSALKEKEIELRKRVGEYLGRGKISGLVLYEVTGQDQAATLNQAVIKNYIKQIKRISDDQRINFDSRLLQTALQMPEAFEKEEEELRQEEWNVVWQTMEEALQEVIRFREQEGQAIENDFRGRIEALRNFLQQIDPHDKARVERIREKLQEKLKAYRNNFEVDQNRFEQELVYYLEKLDITEEKVRLENHFSYFLELLSQQEPVGKKLNFLTQEIGREINTIGSKSNDYEMQRLVVQMKDELEKIREQVMNVL
ncbi:MAG: YicC family protein [Bacteroidales bacterium]|nr:YicC family protein [Bacteroidales bacterium]